MSGVVGAWLPPAEDEHLLQQLAPMLRALQQRGRGRIGYWTDAEAGLALGHCRAPTDTPLQPLSSDCGRYVLCLDGRLYNRADLQSQLRDLPRSCSDARLLLQAIIEWGVERALSRIEGAFGFSVWDRESRELWLARDPVGERPLYYGWYQGRFLFASEMKALQAFAGFAPSIDQDALSLLLRHDYVPAPHTIYRGIHKLVAGTMLRIDLNDHAAGGSSQAAQGGSRYWCARDAMQSALQEPLQPAPSLEQATDQLEAVLQKAIAARMHSPLACGAFLSGGTDSSLVTAMMQSKRGRLASTIPAMTRAIGPRRSRGIWACNTTCTGWTRDKAWICCSGCRRSGANRSPMPRSCRPCWPVNCWARASRWPSPATVAMNCSSATPAMAARCAMRACAVACRTGCVIWRGAAATA